MTRQNPDSAFAHNPDRPHSDIPHTPVEVRHLGQVAYDDALVIQEELTAAKAADSRLPDVLLLLEHPPVYTIGRTPDRSSLDVPGADKRVPVRAINRGGQATYHGPGQLVGYPIVDLRRRKRDLHVYLRALEQALIETAAEYGVAAQRREGYTGVWVADRKLASIGVGVRRWIAMHGFALNVCNDLTPFDAIVPCGIAGVRMTSLQAETGARISAADAGKTAAQAFLRILERDLPRNIDDAH